MPHDTSSDKGWGGHERPGSEQQAASVDFLPTQKFWLRLVLVLVLVLMIMTVIVSFGPGSILLLDDRRSRGGRPIAESHSYT